MGPVRIDSASQPIDTQGVTRGSSGEYRKGGFHGVPPIGETGNDRLHAPLDPAGNLGYPIIPANNRLGRDVAPGIQGRPLRTVCPYRARPGEPEADRAPRSSRPG